MFHLSPDKTLTFVEIASQADYATGGAESTMSREHLPPVALATLQTLWSKGHAYVYSLSRITEVDASQTFQVNCYFSKLAMLSHIAIDLFINHGIDDDKDLPQYFHSAAKIASVRTPGTPCPCETRL